MREKEDGEALWDVEFHPSGKIGHGLRVMSDSVPEASLSGREIRTVEDGADVGGDDRPEVLTWNVSLSILLEMKLAALPRDGRENGPASCIQA